MSTSPTSPVPLTNPATEFEELVNLIEQLAQSQEGQLPPLTKIKDLLSQLMSILQRQSIEPVPPTTPATVTYATEEEEDEANYDGLEVDKWWTAMELFGLARSHEEQFPALARFNDLLCDVVKKLF